MCCPKKLSLSSLQVLKSSAIRPRTFPLSLFSRLRTLLCLTKRPAIFSTFIPNRTEIIIHHLNHEICVNWRKKSIFKENQDSSLETCLIMFPKFTKVHFCFLPAGGRQGNISIRCLILLSDGLDKKRRLNTIQENGFFKTNLFIFNISCNSYFLSCYRQ